MASPRFFCNQYKLALGALINLPDKAANHAARALRMQIGDTAKLFNGDGYDYISDIISIKKGEVVVKIKEVVANRSESPLKITLVQAISSGDRMDYTIQKAVEMGVTHIQPIASQRSVVKLSGDRAEKRVEHWQNVVISACEQSGRALVPEVAMPSSLANWFGSLNAHQSACMKLTLSPHAEKNLHEISKPESDIFLLIGAEGGLTEDEIDLATSQGFIAARLGNRVLRTETAALAAIAAMQTLWGDF